MDCVGVLVFLVLILTTGAAQESTISSEVLVDPDVLDNTDGIISTQSVVSKKQDSKIYCFNSTSNFDLTKIWSPVKVKVYSDDSSWVQVKAAGTDSLHTVLDNLVHRMLGTDSTYDIRERLTEKITTLLLPKPTILTDCPSLLFSSNMSVCELNLSPFGESCIAVRSRSSGLAAQAPKNTKFVVETSSGFSGGLFRLFAVGLGLVLLSHEMGKSKVFHYCAGAFSGAALGLLLLVLFALRRTKKLALPAALVAGYLGTVYQLLRGFAKEIVASYWEYVLGYFGLMIMLGLFLTYKLRSDPQSKHTTRVLVKWTIRFIGFAFLLRSTFSVYVEAMWFVLVLAVYAHHKTHKFSRKEERARREQAVALAQPAATAAQHKQGTEYIVQTPSVPVAIPVVEGKKTK